MPNKVLVFTSPTCAPCKKLKPEMEFQSVHRKFSLEIVELNKDTQEVFAKYNVRAVPTVVCVNEEDEEVGRFIGAQTPTGIESNLVEWGM